jgi:TatD DNase family protein
MIDTHAHLQYECFSSDFDLILERGSQAGITEFVVPGIDLPSSYQSIALAQKYPQIKAAVGIHPYAIISVMNGESSLEELGTEFETVVNDETSAITAIGECGLDYHYFKRENISENTVEEHKSNQMALLQIHFNAARAKKLPIILHTRDSEQDMVRFLKDQLTDDGLIGDIIFHCCPADEDMLAFAIEHSVYIGVDGDVTYDKRKQEFIQKVPLELLLLETDSPYLVPEPVRKQKRFPNEPGN